MLTSDLPRIHQVEDFWTLRCEMSEKLREKIAMLSKEQVNEAKRQVLEAFREYSTDRGMSFPAEVLIVSRTKNGPAIAEPSDVGKSLTVY